MTKHSTPQQLIDKTLSDYNLIADKFSSTRHNITIDLRKLAALVPEGAKVLDYGCGNGRMARLFDADKYLGVDPSNELIKHAKRLHPEHTFRVIKAGEGIKEKFDAIFCLAVIHHLPDAASHKRLLDILSSSLGQGGILILTAWNLAEREVSSDGLVHLPFKYESGEIDRALYPFKQQEMEELAISRGLTIIESRITPRNSGAYSNIEIIAKN